MFVYHRPVRPTLLSPCPMLAGVGTLAVLSQNVTSCGRPVATGTRCEICTASPPPTGPLRLMRSPLAPVRAALATAPLMNVCPFGYDASASGV